MSDEAWADRDALRSLYAERDRAMGGIERLREWGLYLESLAVLGEAEEYCTNHGIQPGSIKARTIIEDVLTAVRDCLQDGDVTEPGPREFTNVCEDPGCMEWATCGTPTPDGYKRLCGDHYRAVQDAAPGGEGGTDGQ